MKESLRRLSHQVTAAELKKGSFTYEDITGVGDSSNDSSSNHQLFPGLAEVDDVNSFLITLVHVGIHQV
jgi:hypothetical protein